MPRSGYGQTLCSLSRRLVFGLQYAHGPHQRAYVPAAYVDALATQQPGQHARSGERILQCSSSIRRISN